MGEAQGNVRAPGSSIITPQLNRGWIFVDRYVTALRAINV